MAAEATVRAGDGRADRDGAVAAAARRGLERRLRARLSQSLRTSHRLCSAVVPDHVGLYSRAVLAAARRPSWLAGIPRDAGVGIGAAPRKDREVRHVGTEEVTT